jgi:all-trans-retinol 13,14-reductase
MNTPHNKFDLIVIGSGIGGLTVASLMAQLRHARVLVLERHFQLGGFTHSFSRGERSWDVGLHYVGNMTPGTLARQLFDLVTRRGVQWHKLPRLFEKFEYPDFTFEVPDDEASYRQALSARFPHEAAAIERYFRDLHDITTWFGIDIFLKSLAAPLAAMIRRLRRGKEQLALQTTRAYLDARFRDPHLKAILVSQWGDYGLPPAQSAFAIHALVAGSYLNGGYYPVGGARTIAKSIAAVIQAHGGQCLAGHEVKEILVDHGAAGGVSVLAQGEACAPMVFYAPVIVSDAGACTTFNRLLPHHVPVPFRDELERAAAGHAFVTLYLGLTANPATLGIGAENHWIYSDYDHDAMFVRRNGVLDGEPAACYLSVQSAKDPAATAHTAQIIAFLDYAQVAAWKQRPSRERGAEYEALKTRIAQGLLAFVDRRYPGFKDLVDYCEVSTPLTMETFTGHLQGTMYGVPATPQRFRLPYLRAKTPVRNLYLTGADVASLGVVGAMMGGVITSAQVLGALGFMRIFSAARKLAAATSAPHSHTPT